MAEPATRASFEALADRDPFGRGLAALPSQDAREPFGWRGTRGLTQQDFTAMYRISVVQAYTGMSSQEVEMEMRRGTLQRVAGLQGREKFTTADLQMFQRERSTQANVDYATTYLMPEYERRLGFAAEPERRSGILPTQLDTSAPERTMAGLLDANRGIALGDEHTNPVTANFLRDQMGDLKRGGVTTLFVEMLPADEQPLINRFMQTGNADEPGANGKTLREALDKWSRYNEDTPKAYLGVLEEARRQNVRVQAIDVEMAGQDFKIGRLSAANDAWASTIRENLAGADGKYVVMGGRYHFTTTPDYTGASLADMLDIPTLGLRTGDGVQLERGSGPMLVQFEATVPEGYRASPRDPLAARGKGEGFRLPEFNVPSFAQLADRAGDMIKPANISAAIAGATGALLGGNAAGDEAGHAPAGRGPLESRAARGVTIATAGVNAVAAVQALGRGDLKQAAQYGGVVAQTVAMEAAQHEGVWMGAAHIVERIGVRGAVAGVKGVTGKIPVVGAVVGVVVGLGEIGFEGWEMAHGRSNWKKLAGTTASAVVGVAGGIVGFGLGEAGQEIVSATTETLWGKENAARHSGTVEVALLAGDLISEATGKPKKEMHFNLFDTNHDGKVNAADAKTALMMTNPVGQLAVAVGATAQFIPGADLNHDGKVDAKDAAAVAGRAAGAAKGTAMRVVRKVHDAADVNHDGKVDAKDAVRAVSKGADLNHDGKVDAKDAVRAVRTVYNVADRNHDGKVDWRDAAKAAGEGLSAAKVTGEGLLGSAASLCGLGKPKAAPQQGRH